MRGRNGGGRSKGVARASALEIPGKDRGTLHYFQSFPGKAYHYLIFLFQQQKEPESLGKGSS